jgi:uncharacterized membrane protein YhaH (DUF805 family)
MSTPAPGWYPDPARPDLTRYWDGTGWTEHTAPSTSAFGAGTNQWTAYAEAPQVGFVEAIKLGFRKYARFDGRAKRSEYWWWALFEVLAVLPFYAIVLASFPWSSAVGGIDANGMPTSATPPTPSPLYLVASLALFVVGLALFVPTISVLVRRLHDTGKSGWWYWIGLVPFIGGILLIVFLATESDRGPNQYGTPSRGAAELT